MFRALGKVRNGNSLTEPLPAVSILISARNEEANIETLLKSLLNQDYKGHYDIWIADDRSTDKTLEILKQFEKKHQEKLHILEIKEIPKNISPKKNAISKLIEASSGEILLLSDADCVQPETWVSAMIREFEPGIDFVAGNSYIEIKKKSALLYMQAVETLSYRIAGTAGLAMKLPLTSTGNNLAYRRTFFTKIKGFENVSHIQSGDDDLLMQKAAKNPWCMRYAINPETFVKTDGKETFKELFEQRKRWASKTIYYTPKTLFVLGGIFLFFLCLTLAPLLSVLNLKILVLALAMFLLKLTADVFLFKRGLKIFRQEFLFKWFIPVEFVHAPFTVFAVLFGIFGKFRWKN